MSMFVVQLWMGDSEYGLYVLRKYWPRSYFECIFFIDFLGLLMRMKIYDAEWSSVPIFSRYMFHFPFGPVISNHGLPECVCVWERERDLGWVTERGGTASGMQMQCMYPIVHHYWSELCYFTMELDIHYNRTQQCKFVPENTWCRITWSTGSWQWLIRLLHVIFGTLHFNLHCSK